MVAATRLRWSLVAALGDGRVPAVACWAWCVLSFFSPTSAAAQEQYEGKTISRVEFDPAEQALERTELQTLLPVKPGQPLRMPDVRSALQKLFATGRYADVAVDATLTPEGQVTLRFLTQPSYFVGGVQVEGVKEPPNAGQLATASKLQLGAEFALSDLRQASDSIEDLLRRNGFYNLNIDTQTERDPVTQQMNIDFRLNLGPRAKFDGLILTGHPEYSESAIIRASGWKRLYGLLGWKPVTENRVLTGVENVRHLFISRDRLLAKVTLAKLDYHPDTNTLTPTLNIEGGPKVRVRTVGAKVSKSKLHGILPIYQERSVDRDLLVEGRRNLVEYFQAQGYFDAQVDFDMHPLRNNEEVIDYTISRGARHKMTHLEVDGNNYFDVETLRERMYLQPASFLRFHHGRYSRQFVEKDATAVRDLYRSNGFRDVKVTARDVDDYRGKKQEIAVFFHIDEGPQWFVASLQMSGVSPEDEEYLRSILHSTEGQPYSDLNVATDRDNILNYYYNNGYPNANFDFTAQPGAKPQQVDLRFVVTPGKRQFVRDVLISGLQTTDPGLVDERVSLNPGDSLSQSRMTESQRRLYDLGIFARVNTAIQNPEGAEQYKYLVYQIEEARKYSVTFGFGAEIARIGGGVTSFDSPAGTTGFSPRVSLGVSRINFLGLGHTIGLQSRVSTLQKRALFSYIAPQFKGRENLSLTFSGLYDDSRDVRTFSARREEGSIQLGQRLSRANSVQYRFTYRKVNILGTPLITPELIPLLSQPVRVGVVSGTFIQDKRDDPTDARRGIYNTVDLGFAAHGFGSQTDFGRLLIRNASYHRLRRDLVLARSTFFGSIQRFGGLSDIPLPERFFSGGSSSHRGFPDNQAGPRDLKTGFPLGGRALLINSAELRFPLIGDNIGGVLFHDMGNVYSGLGHISLRWDQRGVTDFDYAVQSFGFGIRYRTPIGPVRVDLALSPNSPRFLGFQGSREDLLFGRGKFVPQRINVFQFHFSLGQAF